jgi:hypothetical protein
MKPRGEMRAGRRAAFRVAVAGLVILASLLVVSSCGEDDPKVTLSQEDVEAYDEGTPERAALEWWRAIQVSNTELAASYYAEQAVISPGSELPESRDLESQISIAAGAFQGGVEITGVEEDQGEATVFLDLQPPDEEIPPQGRSLNFVDENGEWKLADNSPLIQAVARAQAAQGAPAPPPSDEPEATTTAPAPPPSEDPEATTTAPSE